MELSTQETLSRNMPRRSYPWDSWLGDPSSWAIWLFCQSWIFPRRIFKFTQLSRWGAESLAHLILNPTSYNPVTAPGVTSYNWQEDSKSFNCPSSFLHLLPPFERCAAPSNGSLRFAPGKIFGETNLKPMRWSSTSDSCSLFYVWQGSFLKSEYRVRLKCGH